MFRGLMKFSYRRTPLQAFGWYLTFFAIGNVSAILGIALVVFVGLSIGSEEVVLRARLGGQLIVAVYCVVVGAALLWNRPKSAINILLVAGGVGLVVTGQTGLSVLFGVAAGLIPLAVLTTCPSNVSPDAIKVFE
jgi:hypothetical protein